MFVIVGILGYESSGKINVIGRYSILSLVDGEVGDEARGEHGGKWNYDWGQQSFWSLAIT
jgi:hypothetical protein